MKRFVLDAWAVLALLQGEEPAASQVKRLLEQAQIQQVALFMSIINLGEVFYRVGKLKGENEAFQTLTEIQPLALEVVSATDERVLAAAAVKIQHPISYADAFAAATATELDATLVTGDPELITLQEQFRIQPLSRQQG
jgi:ribonuclease VapC